MLDDTTTAALRQSLFAGEYNLLLGSGASLDSSDRHGKPLLSASVLTTELCKLKGVPERTQLSQVSLLLNDADKTKYLTEPYSHCKPGETVRRLTAFIWRSIFTFNIDDALENAYEVVEHPKQVRESVNFNSTYHRPVDLSTVQIIHLHGFTQKPEDGYVFSATEYGRETRGLNPWMHVLSELIASEPFIISGTSLNEPDLAFYLKDRTELSARSNRGPSILVEPYPNKITENLCERHGLILVEAKLADFLAWLVEKLGAAPSVSNITIPSLARIFAKSVAPATQVTFFSSFELVRPDSPNPEGEVPPFYFGQPPRWSDLESALDVPTPDERELTAKAINELANTDLHPKILCVISATGTGRTTEIRRTAYSLAKEGHLVFAHKSYEAIDITAARDFLMSLDKPPILMVDGLANQATTLRALLSEAPDLKLLVIGADRDYRQDHILRVLGDLNISLLGISPWKQETFTQLIEKLRKTGLLAQRTGIQSPSYFAQQLVGEAVAIGVCRALNDFKPLDIIIRSLWKDSSDGERRSYAIVAIVDRCIEAGVFYPILERAYKNPELSGQFTAKRPLRLSYIGRSDYVVPQQAIVSDRLLRMLSKEKVELLLSQMCALADALAPYVNRKTIIDRTPEAKLAARLFSADAVVRPLLGDSAEEFYVKTQPAWQWNPRYWEQRALLLQSENIEVAIQHARHAVALEGHPFTWTTLASLLAKKMEVSQLFRENLYEEVYGLLENVFEYETHRSWRPTPHPYSTLVYATDIFLKHGGKVTPARATRLAEIVGRAQRLFPRDEKLSMYGGRLLRNLKNGGG